MNDITHPQPKTCVNTMKLLGDFWTLRIIESLSHHSQRFCVIQRELENVNPVTLTSRLKKLEQAKLIVRSHDVDKVAVEYSLTELGKEAVGVVRALERFANKASA